MWLWYRLQSSWYILTPTITNIVNLSLSSGQFHPILKVSVISPLLKKPTLDKDQLSNYRPISNLSLISKIIERVVKSQLTDHLASNGLHNPQQSAYCKHHSTETALLYIHDHLINATGSQKLCCLCLLYLSAAFDTIDHNILITRLSSWFGIYGSVLNWFKSYLTSRSFRVKCDKDFSSSIFLPVVFLKALFSVLYFLYCILLHSALSSSHFLLTITFMQMILNFFSRSILATLTQVSPTSRLLWNTSPPGCLQIFLLLTLPRLNFSSLVLNSNFLK